MSVNQDREAWLLEKRNEIEGRYDRVFAPDYDLRFPHVGKTHSEFLEIVAATLDQDSWVLDVGCGTGKHWDLVFAAGARVIGVDVSQQMLRRAKEKYPFVTVHQQSVQELSVSETFDAVLFVDVLDGVGPEDWPLTLKNLLRHLKRGGILYFTAPDRPSDAELEASLLVARQKGVPAVLGELAHGLSYEFFPTTEQIHQWIGDESLVVSRTSEGEGYRHFLVLPED